MAESQKGSGSPTNSMGLKAFNQTGREETTTEIIRPKKDPKIQQRNAILTVVLIVAFGIAASLAFIRAKENGLDLKQVFSDEERRGFGAEMPKENFNTDN
jgi:hypothetical protein